MSTDTILRQKVDLEKILMSKWDMFQDKRNNIVFKVETQQIKTRLTWFAGGAGGKEPACQRRRCGELGFDLWVWKIPWRRKWQPTLVFLPGKSHGQRSLEGYSPWGHKESDTTEHTQNNIFMWGLSYLEIRNLIFFPLHCKACGILVPQPGIELGPWHWKRHILTLDHQGIPWK